MFVDAAFDLLAHGLSDVLISARKSVMTGHIGLSDHKGLGRFVSTKYSTLIHESAAAFVELLASKTISPVAGMFVVLLWTASRLFTEIRPCLSLFYIGI